MGIRQGKQKGNEMYAIKNEKKEIVKLIFNLEQASRHLNRHCPADYYFEKIEVRDLNTWAFVLPVWEGLVYQYPNKDVIKLWNDGYSYNQAAYLLDNNLENSVNKTQLLIQAGIGI